MRIPLISLTAALMVVPATISRAQQDSATMSYPIRAQGLLADSLREYAIRIGTLLRAMNTEAVLDLYGARDSFVHIENGTALSWPQLSTRVRTYFANARTNPVSIIGEPYVLLLDRDNAVIYVRHRMDATPGQPEHTGIWSGVLRRTPAGWKIVHSHSSDLSPPPPSR